MLGSALGIPNRLRYASTSVRYLSSTGRVWPVLHIPQAKVFRFGAANSQTPALDKLEWSINEGEGWAVVSSGGSEKAVIMDTLLGHTRLSPVPPDGLYPFLSRADPPLDPYESISLVSFVTRPRASGSGFYDFTARYGAVREEDRVTLRESIFESANEEDLGSDFKRLTEQLDLARLLDLPLIALSNGQTRRARIVKELLTKPEVLVLDEPLTGLDVNHRPKLSRLLGEIHASRRPRIILALREQDPLPDWITHVALVKDGKVLTGPRDIVHGNSGVAKGSAVSTESHRRREGKELVYMENVNVKYQERHVLKDINWTIREGDRWYLQGSNGSGKTTLLSILTGDHPQSYTNPGLRLFSLPRRRQPTASLQRLIGAASPEQYNAFPRRFGPDGLTVRDAIATGFESTFCYRRRTPEEEVQIDALLAELGPESWSDVTMGTNEVFGKRCFAELPPGEQSLVLLLRALAGKPPLLILDEVFAGMDARMIGVAKRYLREKLEPHQAVVFVTHWEEEVPWAKEGVRRLKLEDGMATSS